MGERPLVRLTIAVLAVLAAAWLLQMAVGLFGGNGAGATAHTAAHFRSPAFPPIAGLGLVPLLLLPFFLTALYFLSRAGDAAAAQADEPPLAAPPADGAGGFPLKSLAVALPIFLCAAIGVKAFSLQPMVTGEGRMTAAIRFASGFNRALLAKATFDEKRYVSLMCEALLADRPAFAAFARSWYWAYYADERITRDSWRRDAALATLEPLYRDGRLTDPAAFELAKLFFENGMAQKARVVINSLLTRHPLNAEYAEFKAALATENEK